VRFNLAGSGENFMSLREESMKINTDMKSHMIYKGPVENAKQNTQEAVDKAVARQFTKKGTEGFKELTRKGFGVDTKA